MHGFTTYTPLFLINSLHAEQQKGKVKWKPIGICVQEALVPLTHAGAIVSSTAVPLLHTMPPCIRFSGLVLGLLFSFSRYACVFDMILL